MIFNSQNYIDSDGLDSIDGEWIDTATVRAFRLSYLFTATVASGKYVNGSGVLSGTNRDDKSQEALLLYTTQDGVVQTGGATLFGGLSDGTPERKGHVLYERLPRWVRFRYTFVEADIPTTPTLSVAIVGW